jgi:hypothetical protein
MNAPNWVELIAAIGSLLGGIGFFAAAASLVYLARQTRAGERATTAAVYQSIVSMGDSINDMFIERPELYVALFPGAPVPAGSDFKDVSRTNPQQYFAALRWLDYFETVLVLWSAIPAHLHEPWRAYITDCLRGSELLQYLVLETDWYGEDLRGLCRAAKRETIEPSNRPLQPTSGASLAS